MIIRDAGDTLFLIMNTDGKKKKEFLGLILLNLSGILCIISEFILWTNEFSIFNLFQLEIANSIIYLIPLVGGFGILLSALNIAIFKRKSYKFWYILLVIILNLLFYFLLEVFSNQGAYLWRYMGIYTTISALLCLLFGILFQINARAENP
ncbi:hypothetical protein DSAG12_01824 [Promethearchaeum syntrophicum]|uniref:Uncharacterized protein n=1 Tax=Promethearchaeum syntrophicum TaxID=2594042 RepID=A0A5B9DBG6_9ARCH|nr:hypothetical protein [Candidatus Prometheoarchaeum syntrophicum]QEE15996.1 hypothetical protein DSAG12_01824 [Candidatus Prometheoarchaeum syntrophicum]